MNWMMRIQKAIDYIELHLEDTIDLQEAAKRAECSPYLFQRIFSYTTDVSIAEYIRKRRLALAAQKLLNTNDSIMQIALRYGYESPTSFTRAFQSLYKLTPSSARKNKIQLASYPKFCYPDYEEHELKFSYEHKPSFFIKGITKSCDIYSEAFQQISGFWTTSFMNGSFSTLYDMQEEDDSMYGIGHGFDNDKQQINYTIGIKTADHTGLEIASSEYVVFYCEGALPASMQNVWKQICQNWLPHHDIQLSDGPQIEWYPNGNTFHHDYKCEIWLPIKNKS